MKAIECEKCLLLVHMYMDRSFFFLACFRFRRSLCGVCAGYVCFSWSVCAYRLSSSISFFLSLPLLPSPHRFAAFVPPEVKWSMRHRM